MGSVSQSTQMWEIASCMGGLHSGPKSALQIKPGHFEGMLPFREEAHGEFVMSVYVYIYIYIYIHTYMYIYIYIYAYIHSIHTHKNIHTYIHTYIHKYIYIYTLRTNPGKKLDIGNFLPESNLFAGK